MRWYPKDKEGAASYILAAAMRVRYASSQYTQMGATLVFMMVAQTGSPKGDPYLQSTAAVLDLRQK